jgi:hypothetical protein
MVVLVFVVALEMAAWEVSASTSERALRRATLNLILPWCFLEMAVVTAPAKYKSSGQKSLQLFQFFGCHLLSVMVEVLLANSGTNETFLGVCLLGVR